MAITSRSNLKNIYVTGAKPTQQNFTDWLDSYQHVTDALPAAAVTNAILAAPVNDLTAALRGLYYEYAGRLFIVDGGAANATDSRTQPGIFNISVPYKTIQAACAAAAAAFSSEGITYSATILVQPGFYPENVSIPSMCGVNLIYNGAIHYAATSTDSALSINSSRPVRICLVNSTIQNDGASGNPAVSVTAAYGLSFSGDGNSSVISNNNFALNCGTGGTAPAYIKGLKLVSNNASALTSQYTPFIISDCTITANKYCFTGTIVNISIDRSTVTSGNNCINQANTRSGYLRITNSVLVSDTGYIAGGGAVGSEPLGEDYIYNCRLKAGPGILQLALGNVALYWYWRLEQNIMEVTAATIPYAFNLEQGMGLSRLDTFSNRCNINLYTDSPANVVLDQWADYNSTNTKVLY